MPPRKREAEHAIAGRPMPGFRRVHGMAWKASDGSDKSRALSKGGGKGRHVGVEDDLGQVEGHSDEGLDLHENGDLRSADSDKGDNSPEEGNAREDEADTGSDEDGEEEEDGEPEEIDPDDLPPGYDLPAKVQEAMESVRASWPRAPEPQAPPETNAKGKRKRGAGDAAPAQQGEQWEELEGAVLVRAAKAAWRTLGYSDAAAGQLARAMADLAESRYIAPCLTLPRFSRLFQRMAAALTAARTARGLLNTAHSLLRHGNTAAAVAALGSASCVASAGASGDDAPGTEASREAAAEAGAAAGAAALRAASAQAMEQSGEEVSELVLAPRCCVEARLRLAQLLLLDPADQQDLGTAEALLVRSLQLVEAASSSVTYEEPVAPPSTRPSAASKGSGSRALSNDAAKGGGSTGTTASTGAEAAGRASKEVGEEGALQLRSLEELRKACLSKLCMLLCQEGRDEEARGFMDVLGCRFRLAKGVLCYTLPSPGGKRSQGKEGQGHSAKQKPKQAAHAAAGQTQARSKRAGKTEGKKAAGEGAAAGKEGVPGSKEPAAAVDPSRYVQAVDGAIPPHIMSLMKASFSPDSPFWSEHGYSQESPYFSYLHPLQGNHPRTALDQVIQHIQSVATYHFPAVKEAKYAEWWAHCRPHGSGHQMHFDSDNEGLGEVRNPIISTVMYLTGSGIGGPTLVTDQAFSATRLAAQGWMVHPEAGRLTMFDGSVLHGVVPGRGPSPRPGEHRVTFMVAFWRDIRSRPRPDGLPGASQPFPLHANPSEKQDEEKTTEGACMEEGGQGACGLPGPECFASSLRPVWKHTWHKAFQGQLAAAPGTDGDGGKPGNAVMALPVQPVWEVVNPSPRNTMQLVKGLPKYELCFQGF